MICPECNLIIPEDSRYCPTCGVAPVPDEELPVMLPGPDSVPSFRGEVLAQVAEFIDTRCPQCGKPLPPWWKYDYCSQSCEAAR